MATPITSTDRLYKHPDELLLFTFDYTNDLGSNETLTGTPTVEEITTTDLTIGTPAINSSAVTVNGVEIAAGKAVQVTIAAGVDGSTYKLECDADTTVSGQNFIIIGTLIVSTT